MGSRQCWVGCGSRRRELQKCNEFQLAGESSIPRKVAMAPHEGIDVHCTIVGRCICAGDSSSAQRNQSHSTVRAPACHVPTWSRASPSTSSLLVSPCAPTHVREGGGDALSCMSAVLQAPALLRSMQKPLRARIGFDRRLYELPR